MNLEFSEEQRLLRDSVERFVAQRYGFNERREIAESPERFSASVWQSMAGFGWLALPLPEADGGLGGGAVDVGIVMEGLGRGLVLEPLLSVAVVAGSLIAEQGSSAQRDRWLGALADGSLRCAFAHAEPSAGMLAPTIGTRAVAVDGGWRLDGTKTQVLDGPGAASFLVSARLGDESGPIGLFMVPADAQGLRIDAFETQDDRRAARLKLDAVRVGDADRLDGAADAREAIAHALDLAVAGCCAEAVGCMQVLLDATLEYTKTRVQFGQPLAANQVLRHRMVDMAIACEESRAIALRAALACDARPVDPAARARAVSGAKLKIVEASRFVAQQAVQLHGGMGVTDELNVGVYFKRLLCIESSWGTRAEHMARAIANRRPATQEA